MQLAECYAWPQIHIYDDQMRSLWEDYSNNDIYIACIRKHFVFLCEDVVLERVGDFFLYNTFKLTIVFRSNLLLPMLKRAQMMQTKRAHRKSWDQKSK